MPQGENQDYHDDGYRQLICAIIRQALVDARGRGDERPLAIAFLTDPRRVGYLCALIGCDPVRIHRGLLRAAGLVPGPG